MAQVETIYIEEAVREHPRTLAILARFPQVARVITIADYGAVFKPQGQSFRLQKSQPALILAAKNTPRVLPTPEGFGIGGQQNYYFSTMLNCPFDCRYCFLQGMYSSGHYVVFVNYEDFFADIATLSTSHPGAYFFSGYDADSLAFTHKTGFVTAALAAFRAMPNAHLELRTKSLNIGPLLASPPSDRVIIAFSLTPDIISRQVEHRVPPLAKRLAACQKLAQAGWQVGLRFDPLIYDADYQDLYRTLVHQAFKGLPTDKVHSVSVGPMRFPQAMYKKISSLYPEEPLLAHPLQKRQGMYSYSAEREAAMQKVVRDAISVYLNPDKVFTCSVL